VSGAYPPARLYAPPRAVSAAVGSPDADWLSHACAPQLSAAASMCALAWRAAGGCYCTRAAWRWTRRRWWRGRGVARGASPCCCGCWASQRRGAASVASLLAAILTEIYLCNVCSGHEILRRNGLGGLAGNDSQSQGGGGGGGGRGAAAASPSPSVAERAAALRLLNAMLCLPVPLLGRCGARRALEAAAAGDAAAVHWGNGGGGGAREAVEEEGGRGGGTLTLGALLDGLQQQQGAAASHRHPGLWLEEEEEEEAAVGTDDTWAEATLAEQLELCRAEAARDEAALEQLGAAVQPAAAAAGTASLDSVGALWRAACRHCGAAAAEGGGGVQALSTLRPPGEAAARGRGGSRSSLGLRPLPVYRSVRASAAALRPLMQAVLCDGLGAVPRAALRARWLGAAVSRSCSCSGSPCLRQRVHGASIGAAGLRRPQRRGGGRWRR
jgi:hypothetical protein